MLTIKNMTVEDQAYYICNATIGDRQQNLGLAYLQLVSGKLYHVLPPVSQGADTEKRSTCCTPLLYLNSLKLYKSIQKIRNDFSFG